MMTRWPSPAKLNLFLYITGRIAVIEKLKQRLQGMVTIGPLAGDI